MADLVKRNEIVTEFYKYINKNSGSRKQMTLTYENPCYISFFVTSALGYGNQAQAVINNTINLIWNQSAGLPKQELFQNYIVFECPPNSIDKTIYSLDISDNTQVLVVVKYYKLVTR
jgi:hypothetical protein